MTKELDIGGIYRICGIQGEQTEKGGIHGTAHEPKTVVFTAQTNGMYDIWPKNCSILCTQALNGGIHRICGIQGKQTENCGIQDKRTHNRWNSQRTHTE